MAIKRSALSGLANAMPSQNKEIAKQQDAARAIRLQQAVSQMPTQAATQPQAAQQLGSQQAQIAGQQAQQQQAATQQTAQQVTQLAAQQQQQAASGQTAAAEAALKREGIATESELSEKQRQVEDQIFQDQIQFQKDELGRTEYSQEQMMDLALWSAQSTEDFKDRVQTIEQEADKELALLQALHNSIETTLKGSFAMGEQQLDQASKERMVEVQRELQRRIEDRQKKAAKRGTYGQVGGLVGGIGGGIVGGYLGGPVGAVAGAAAGSAAGTAGGTAMAENS